MRRKEKVPHSGHQEWKSTDWESAGGLRAAADYGWPCMYREISWQDCAFGMKSHSAAQAQV